MTFDYRLVAFSEYKRAAAIHRGASALIPGYNTDLHNEAEFETFYKETVFAHCKVIGAYLSDELVGFIALLPGWIDHLYVDVDHHNMGIGGALVRLAQSEQDELRLYTFQSNVRAQRLYEKFGFIAEELTDGERNEEKMPDMTNLWRRPV